MSVGVELRPDLVRRHLALLASMASGQSGLASRCGARRGRPGWSLFEGCNLLLRWSGERLPLPALGDPDARQAEVVGFAAADATQIDTFDDTPHAVDTIYHYGLVQVGGGGVPNELHPFETRTVYVDAGGDLHTGLPNAPAVVSVRLLPGDLPLVTWMFSTAHQQAAASEFRVYAADDVSAFDFEDPIGTVSYVANQTRYEWTGEALSPSDVRYYTVRSATAGGVLSLIPRTGLCPSGSYSSVDKGRCPMVQVPAGLAGDDRPGVCGGAAVSLWDGRDLARYRRNEEAVLSRLRNEPVDDLFVQPPGSGEVNEIVGAVITGLDDDNTTFLCKRYDENGDPTGDEFKVYVASTSDGNTEIGTHPLPDCHPNLEAGYKLRIQWQTFWHDGEGGDVTGWWAVGEFPGLRVRVTMAIIPARRCQNPHRRLLRRCSVPHERLAMRCAAPCSLLGAYGFRLVFSGIQTCVGTCYPLPSGGSSVKLTGTGVINRLFDVPWLKEGSGYCQWLGQIATWSWRRYYWSAACDDGSDWAEGESGVGADVLYMPPNGSKVRVYGNAGFGAYGQRFFWASLPNGWAGEAIGPINNSQTNCNNGTQPWTFGWGRNGDP